MVLFLAFSLASLVETAPSLPDVEVLHQKQDNMLRETPEQEAAKTSGRGTTSATTAWVHKSRLVNAG